MFRRALRLGARVSVASCAAVVPATAASCFQGDLLSDSRTPGCIEINDFGAVPVVRRMLLAFMIMTVATARPS